MTSAILSGGVLTVTGTPAADAITVQQGAAAISVSGVAGSFPLASVARVVVQGRMGNDVIDCRGLTKPITLNGGDGGDRFLLDLTSPVTLSGYQAADRIEFSNPQEVLKYQVSSRGSLFALATNNQLYIRGTPTWSNVRDFAADSQGKLVLLDNANTLKRSRSFDGTGSWDTMGTGVNKWRIAANGVVWALQANGQLLRNGAVSWNDKADFGFDSQNRAILLDTAANGGTLVRSKQTFGSGGWDRMGTGVIKWRIAANGVVWALQANGNLLRDGAISWMNKADFTFDSQNRVILLDTAANGGTLLRAKQAYASGGWVTLGVGVTKWRIAANGVIWALQSNGNLLRDGVLSWTNKADFGFDSQNRAILLDTAANGGTLVRAKQAYASGGWDIMGTGVKKWRVAANDVVWALQTNGDLLRDGSLSWTNKADFGFDSQNRAILLDTAANGGTLVRAKQAYASGGWDTMGTEVIKWRITEDDVVWALQTNGDLLRDGSLSWTDKADFGFDSENRAILLDTTANGGAILRSKQPYGSNGFDPLETNVAAFRIDQDGRLWLRRVGEDATASEYVLGGQPSSMLSNGALIIFGTGDADTITVTSSSVTIVSPGGTVTRTFTSISRIVVHGGAGADTIDLSGTAKPAQIWGGVGDDRLFGGSGADGLYGSSGNDVLFGAAGADLLRGGLGIDRLLLQPGDVDGDDGFVIVDARIHFTGNWTTGEIKKVNVAFDKLQARTGNVRLLRLSGGGELTFQRAAFLGTDVLADNNSSGLIRVANLAFTTNQNVNPVWAIVIHEIGHNWDESSENPSFNFTSFYSQSGYVSWYAAPPYSRHEDFCETLATTFLTSSRYRPNQAPGKVAVMNAWLNSI